MTPRITAGWLAALSLTVAAAAPAAVPDPCNRACLKDLAGSYLAALVAHDPAKVPLAADVKFVENVTPMKPGEGLWKTASEAPSTFALYVPDPTSEQVGFIGMMKADGKPIELALRLKVRHGQIVEAEHLIAGNLRDTMLANLHTPRPGLLAVVPKDERSTHAQLLKIGATYYEALVKGNGSLSPFAEDCERHENGMITTGNALMGAPAGSPKLGCATQLDTKVMSYIKRIEPRRVWIADTQTGLVFGLSQFRHPMKEDHVNIVGYPGVTSVPMKFKPFDLPAAHIFKVSGGKIHEIEAMGFMAPYNSKTGWEH
ncbi:MAG TPA: hypothetical protein VGV09_11130 [Steroidobacteraceae bacterium]|nr:hypothetical protein [Steroidobacteraceae bacterium]